ncbi:hypothetical protein J6590_056569 [Homalodisca vitripennis]|nr:hypothetical protein J6590_056569 [Homalodisca vitripennis]
MSSVCKCKLCPELAKLDFTGSLLNRNRRSRKRAHPKLGAKHKKKQHATSGKRIEAHTAQLDDGTEALAGRGHSILGLKTRRTSHVDGTHGNPAESRRISQPWASGRTVDSTRITSPLPNVNHLTSTNQSIQAENNQYGDGVTPPPTDKSGRVEALMNSVQIGQRGLYYIKLGVPMAERFKSLDHGLS